MVSSMWQREDPITRSSSKRRTLDRLLNAATTHIRHHNCICEHFSCITFFRKQIPGVSAVSFYNVGVQKAYSMVYWITWSKVRLLRPTHNHVCFEPPWVRMRCSVIALGVVNAHDTTVTPGEAHTCDIPNTSAPTLNDEIPCSTEFSLHTIPDDGQAHDTMQAFITRNFVSIRLTILAQYRCVNINGPIECSHHLAGDSTK